MAPMASNKQKIPDKMHVEFVSINELKPHPRNYLTHPEDEILHLCESLTANGFYHNVITANDLTILAGHGIISAAKRMTFTEAPIVRLPIAPDSEAALKILAGDNEVGHLAEINDRLLTDLLQELKVSGSLLGTGYDENMLAARLFSTRNETEIVDFDAAKEWVGMPEFEESTDVLKIVVNFLNEAHRMEFIAKTKLKVAGSNRKTMVSWYPERKNNDIKSIKFEEA